MNKRKKVFFIVPIVLIVVVLLVYLGGVIYYKSHFFDGTEVYGTDVSGKKIEDFKSGLSEYSLEVIQLDEEGNTFSEILDAEAVGISVASTESLEQVLDEQNCWLWPRKTDSIHCAGENLIQYDSEKIAEAVKNLTNVSGENLIEPKNAEISEYIEGTGYEIIPDEIGTVLDVEATTEAVKNAVIQMKESVDLKEEGCYKQAKVTKDDKKLNKLLKKLNKYISAKITYQFGEETEVIDGELIQTWIKVKKGKITFDEEKIREFIAMLRSNYDTIFCSREFKTSYGKKIKISGGDYGWWINTVEELKAIKKLIKKGKEVERTPEYYQTAASYGENDYGDTYVEINLTAQHLLFYKNGKFVMESDFVSGNHSRGYDTPEGVYGITYKETDATLVGEDYSTPVSYWMPFNRNIGMHDASWRSSFGGKIYLTNGSHGCVNLPPDAAKKLFGLVEKGTPVICYQQAGTEESGDVGKNGFQPKKESKKNKN